MEANMTNLKNVFWEDLWIVQEKNQANDYSGCFGIIFRLSF